MKERPILFSGAMVRAILEGRKTQTRRVIKRGGKLSGCVLPDDLGGAVPSGSGVIKSDGVFFGPLHCPYGQPGDRLWVRETFHAIPEIKDVYYRASEPEGRNDLKWKPSIFMPRWASRITLEITGIRVERLNEISEVDAIAEGVANWSTEDDEDHYYAVEEGKTPCADDPVSVYEMLWDSINGLEAWKANPWVWVVEFKRVEANG